MQPDERPVSVFYAALLLFVSGGCALVFQVTWMREFHLIFGGSTAAGAAVLAIFMGGLGLGSAWLGPKADNHPQPFAFYGLLVIGISLFAFLSPYLIYGIRQIYIATGGHAVLGFTGGTIVRLLLSTLILGFPTVLMGGTLPAAVRAATTRDDISRRNVAVLYGLNTLGAVVGAFVCTFYLIEHLGHRHTLWLACAVNFVAGLIARELSHFPAPESSAEQSAEMTAASAIESEESETTKPEEAPQNTIPHHFVFFAAGMAGFSFFLMEIVWYRMLSPIMGGTTYTFGLILAIALFGIGSGGWAYSLLFRHRRVTAATLALTFALESFCMIFPYALGDRLAFFALVLRRMSIFGFQGDMIGWTLIAGIVVFPAAFISGIQFPVLIALLGQARKQIARQTGYACAFNTLGAILGSLAGGFGFLPAFSATGCWVLVAVILILISAGACVFALKNKNQSVSLYAPALVILLTIAMTAARGPTAIWRHGSIGARRFKLSSDTINGRIADANSVRRSVLWEADGVESGVAVITGNGISFVINGKIDGNAYLDASTQIMFGLLGSLLHPQPENCMVVGLGTGESAGWLAEVETMKQVDVVELEPALDEMAERCAPVNFDVLNHPKVNRIYNDAREVLLTVPKQYDLIVSEPSNPYRAGIAMLFTKEFYLSCRERLNEGGMLLQWLQAYEIDADTVRTVLATLRSVFDEVQIWEARTGDLVLVCSRTPIRCDLPRLRQRITQHPYDKALAVTWRMNEAEGVLAHFVAGSPLATRIYDQEQHHLNTDDKNRVEYGFARTVGRKLDFSVNALRRAAQNMGCGQPEIENETGERPVDWIRVQQLQIQTFMDAGQTVTANRNMNPRVLAAIGTRTAFQRGEMLKTLKAWPGMEGIPTSPTELMMTGIAYAHLKSDDAERAAGKLDNHLPAEAAIIRLSLAYHRKQQTKAFEDLMKCLVVLQSDPWIHPRAKEELFVVIRGMIPTLTQEQAVTLFKALDKPFCIRVGDDWRIAVHTDLGKRLGAPYALDVLHALEPWPVWSRQALIDRANYYTGANDPLEQQARDDLRRFLQHTSTDFGEALRREGQ